MTNKYIIQNKLKYIFSNNNILLNSIDFCKKNNIDDKHLQYIIQSIDKFLACREENIMTVKLKRRPWTLFPNFTGKTKDSSLMSVTVTSTAQRVLSDISEDISPVLLLLNTRLLTLLTRRLLSFLTTWLMIKRKLALLCLLRDLFPIF